MDSHMGMSTLELIVEELKHLPQPKLEEAATLIHQLRERSHAEQLAILRETAGSWCDPDGAIIEKAIQEGS